MPHTTESRKKSMNTPGPGYYNIEKNPSTNMLDPIKPASESAFKSTSSKSQFLKEWNREPSMHPAVGHYDFERNNILRKT